MSSKRCCVPQCPVPEGPQIFLHWFPKPGKDIARFRAWVHAIGGEILSLSNENIYKIRRVCHAHFEEKYCCRNNRISKIAVPTLLMPDSASKFTHSGRIPLKDIENVASTSEEVCDAADNESLHKDDKEPSSPHLDVKYDGQWRFMSMSGRIAYHQEWHDRQAIYWK